MRRCFCLLFVAGFLVFALGCGEDTPPVDPEPPKVVSTIPEDDGIIPSNATITVYFSKPMRSVGITVSGATGTTAIQGKTATWAPSPLMPPGTHTLTVTGEDELGQKLVVFEPITFEAAAGCTVLPEIDDNECKPKNGTTDVDPQQYQKGFFIAFSEPLSEAKVISTDPEFLFVAELIDKGKAMEVNFQNYTMPNNTEFKITLDITDLAGNQTEAVYSFTTI